MMLCYAMLLIVYSEMMFNIDHLCMNTYFRSFMDEAGYIPIAFVANYPNIACYGASLTDLLSKLHQKDQGEGEGLEGGGLLEVDMENETIRLKTGWEAVCYVTYIIILALYCIILL